MLDHASVRDRRSQIEINCDYGRLSTIQVFQEGLQVVALDRNAPGQLALPIVLIIEQDQNRALDERHSRSLRLHNLRKLIAPV